MNSRHLRMHVGNTGWFWGKSIVQIPVRLTIHPEDVIGVQARFLKEIDSLSR